MSNKRKTLKTLADFFSNIPNRIKDTMKEFLISTMPIIGWLCILTLLRLLIFGY